MHAKQLMTMKSHSRSALVGEYDAFNKSRFAFAFQIVLFHFHPTFQLYVEGSLPLGLLPPPTGAQIKN
jgi:hypothetical protein